MRKQETMPVVVGVTGTAEGLAAVRLAARESVARGQQLRVVHAFSWPGFDPSSPGIPYDQLRHRADEMLARAVTAATRSCPGAQVTGYVVDGAPTRVLLQQSRTAALLVLGDHDPGAPVPLPTESVLAQAVARSRCPVLVARGVGTADGPVVVGVDGSRSAGLALRYAATEAVRRHAGLQVVHVRDTEDDPPPDPANDAAARYLLENALAEAGLTGGPVAPADRRVESDVGSGAAPLPPAAPPVVSAQLLTGDPATVLIRAATRARMLVVGPNGTDSRFGALLGAVAQNVLRRSGCPTVFVHDTSASRRPADQH